MIEYKKIKRDKHIIKAFLEIHLPNIIVFLKQ